MTQTKTQLGYREFRKYLLALGKFIHSYSAVEGMWHMALRKWAGIDKKLSRAMTGGMRSSEVINTFKRILKVTGANEATKKEIHVLIEQFNAISEFRDRLIHRGAIYDSDLSKLISTNEIYYRTLEDFESLAFESSDIENASTDLVKINLRMIVCILPPGDAEERLKKKLMKWTHEPWRYKRIQRNTPNQAPTAKKIPKHERSPRA